MSYEISVVIPVYNVEDYIAQCLDSIVNQTIGIENIEVIIVNDQTPDNSMSIVREYALKYPSFKIVNNPENLGLGESRNEGLKHVTSDYVTFVDSDDFISENTFKDSISKLKSTDSDLLVYNWMTYTGEGYIEPEIIHNQNTRENRVISDINDDPRLLFSTASWNKIYHKSLFKYLNYSKGLYEDNIVTISVLLNATSIYLSRDSTYYYRKNMSSITRHVGEQNIYDLSDIVKSLFEFKDDRLKPLIINFINDILSWIYDYDWSINREIGFLEKLKNSIEVIDVDDLDHFKDLFANHKLHYEDILNLFNLDSETFLARYKYFPQLDKYNFEASLYVDLGEGFNEDDKLTFNYTPDRHNSLTFPLYSFENIRRLRFDVCEDVFIKSKITNNLNITFADSDNGLNEEYQLFLNMDPFYIIEGEFGDEITIDFEVEILKNADLAAIIAHRNDEIIRLNNPHNFQASIYVDTGDGFNESQKVSVDYKPLDMNNLTFDLTRFENIVNLRFDLCEGYFVKGKIINDVKVKESNSNMDDDGYQVFLNPDPYYILEGDFGNVSDITVSFEIRILSNQELFDYLNAGGLVL